MVLKHGHGHGTDGVKEVSSIEPTCLFSCLINSRTLKRVVSEEAEEELRPQYKLPGELNDWTGNVLYPDEESKKWDVNGTILCTYQYNSPVGRGGCGQRVGI